MNRNAGDRTESQKWEFIIDDEEEEDTVEFDYNKVFAHSNLFKNGQCNGMLYEQHGKGADSTETLFAYRLNTIVPIPVPVPSPRDIVFQAPPLTAVLLVPEHGAKRTGRKRKRVNRSDANERPSKRQKEKSN